MGKRDRLRREAFFSAHPLCCFCGGSERAVEEDHVPGRHLFRGRQWPEGYVFPACAACNDASALDELVLGWIVRIKLDDYDEVDGAEATSAIEKLRRRRPEWVEKMRQLSRIQTRGLLRERSLSVADFPNGEVYAMTIPDEYSAAMARYADKLGRALYYLHTGRIVPSGGIVRARALTNVEFTAPTFHLEDFHFLASKPALARSGRNLEDQFAYRYAAHPEGGAAGFLVQFGQSIAMAILAVADEAAYRAELDSWESSVSASGAA